MGINIPIEEIERYQDDYLWDDVKEHTKMILWETGLYSWTNLDSSASEYDIESISDSRDNESENTEDTMNSFDEMIEEIVDGIEEREEIIDITDILFENV